MTQDPDAEYLLHTKTQGLRGVWGQAGVKTRSNKSKQGRGKSKIRNSYQNSGKLEDKERGES